MTNVAETGPIPLQCAVEIACKHLPDGHELLLRMENGAATVQLHDDNGERMTLPDAADKTLAEELHDAVFVSLYVAGMQPQHRNGCQLMSQPEPPTKRKGMKPGPGWAHLGGPEWKHESGAWVHVTAGLVRTANGASKLKVDHQDEAMRFIRANGGDLPVGLMAWALSLNA